MADIELTAPEKARLAKNFSRVSSNKTLDCYFGYELAKLNDKGRDDLLNAYEETVVKQGFAALEKLDLADLQFGENKKHLKRIFAEFSSADKAKSKAVRSAVILSGVQLPAGFDTKVKKIVALKGEENAHPLLAVYNRLTAKNSMTEFEKKVHFVEAVTVTEARIAETIYKGLLPK